MECCCFLIVAIIIILSNVSKAKVGSDNSAENVNLDDIFKEVTKNSRQSSSLPSSSSDVVPLVVKPQRKSHSRPPAPTTSSEEAVARETLVTPTRHDSHICEDVNYDNMASLEGGTGSFNLGDVDTSSPREQVQSHIKMGREDLLKSFIMSEVLQKYDINRIYSRIPSIKTDD